MIDKNAEHLAAGGRLVSELGPSIVRALPEKEIEIKYDMPAEGDPSEVLARLVDHWRSLDSLIVDRVVDGETVMHPRYLTSGTVEYSTFQYCGAPLVKIKNHNVHQSGGVPVMVSTESFLEDESALRWIEENESRFPWSLVKRRAKVFVLSRRTHDVFSAAVTLCTAADDTRQSQLEIEYFGSVGAVPAGVDDIVALVARAGTLMTEGITGVVPTTETKLEFARRHDSKVEEPA